jgi:hypothetical protein
MKWEEKKQFKKEFILFKLETKTQPTIPKNIKKIKFHGNLW